MATPSTAPRRRNVAEFLGNIYREHPAPTRMRIIAIDQIHVLCQTRRTFDRAYIESLAANIKSQGLQTPLQVVRYKRKGFQDYLTSLNLVWRTRYRRSMFRPVREPDGLWYYVLIAGECRIRSLRLLGATQAKVTLGTNVDPITALLNQQIENTYNPPPPHEQAFAWLRIFTVMRMADPTFPLAAFARYVNRSPDMVRRALLFCDLPPHIQFAVQNKELPYGIALELTRLKEISTPAESTELMRLAKVRQMRVPDFRRLVSQRLQIARSGQIDLIGMMGAEQERLARKAARRRTVDGNYGQALSAALRYVQLVAKMVSRGELGTDESPYADGSVRDRLRLLVDTLELEHPHLRKVMRRIDAQRLTTVIPKIRRVLST